MIRPSHPPDCSWSGCACEAISSWTRGRWDTGSSAGPVGLHRFYGRETPQWPGPLWLPFPWWLLPVQQNPTAHLGRHCHMQTAQHRVWGGAGHALVSVSCAFEVLPCHCPAFPKRPTHIRDTFQPRSRSGLGRCAPQGKRRTESPTSQAQPWSLLVHSQRLGTTQVVKTLPARVLPMAALAVTLVQSETQALCGAHLLL